jgi:hypothetical protein
MADGHDGASERRNETTRARAEAALLFFPKAFVLHNNRAAGRIEENTHTHART